jgi:3-phenylpropionate/trans-cinnamate dioxygenase ferredoxin reductase subunit
MSPDRHVRYLLIGGGLASVSCAEALRKRGAEGEILLASREPDPPYDRPPCSKEYLRGERGAQEIQLHPASWYRELAIELRTRTSVMRLDAAARTAKLSDRSEVGFDCALLATGANVRRLNVPGAELEGIHYLRTLHNADAIRSDCAGRRVVLIGGSYIGCEVAASLSELGASATVVMIEREPLSRGFGEQAGRFFRGVLEDHGVSVHGGQELDRLEGSGRVQRVLCKSGLALEADAVVIGAGAVPDVMLARAAGLELGQSGGVLVDETLATSAPGIWAAGDIAEYRSVVHDGSRLRIEHWDVAMAQGRHAAGAMLGESAPYDVVPYFFSDLSDWVSLEYLGPARDWDRELVRGSIQDGAFTIFYLEDSRVRGALSVGRSEDLQVARQLIYSGERLGERVETLADLGSDLEALAGGS